MMQYLNQHKVFLLVLSSVIYFLFGYFYVSGYDIRVYNLPWILAFKNINLLHLYDQTFVNPLAFNYPPILGVIYYLIHQPVIWAYTHHFIHLAYLLIKLPFILIHFLILFGLYRMKHEKTLIFWMVNPIWVVITAMWGQFDEVFCFMIYVLIDRMAHQKYKNLWSLFALMCLFKHQGAYFVFPLCLYTWVVKVNRTTKIKEFVKGVGIGIFGWLPFMLLYQDIVYPIKFMLHALYLPSDLFSTSCNFWLFIELFLSTNIYHVLERFSLIFILIAMCIGLMVYQKTQDMIVSIYIYFFSIFMITLKQLDRYFVYFFMVNVYMIFISHGHQIRYKKTLIIALLTNFVFLIFNNIKWNDVMMIVAVIVEFAAATLFCIEYIDIVSYVLTNVESVEKRRE